MKYAVAIFLAAFIALYASIEGARGFGLIVPPGASFDLRTGEVVSVDAGSPAARAGIRLGDRFDFAHTPWTAHLSLDRQYIFAGEHRDVPLVRGGRPLRVTLVGPSPAPPPDAWTNFVELVFMLALAGLGATLFLMHRSEATIVFLALACSRAITFGSLDPLKIAPANWMPLAMLIGSIGPGILEVYGLLYFSLLFTNKNRSTDARLKLLLIWPSIAIILGLYYLHFYTYTVLPEFSNVYLLFSVLQFAVYVIAAWAITARVYAEPSAARLRWVAVGIWLQAIVFAIFFIDQNTGLRALRGNVIIGDMNAWFQPSVLCIAYVLMRTRVIDARVVGARTIVYGLLTAIPIGLFSIADWFFSRKLADARLATFVEFGVAVAFGIWLNTLHKRIDRFVERIVFSARHHAFTQVRNAIHALGSAERSTTVLELLIECGNALKLASAAVFVYEHGPFVRKAGYGWETCAETLESDDPVVLFARSHSRLVHTADFTPTRSIMPGGDCRPEIAIPMTIDHQTAALVFYGRHTSGEHVDSNEEDLLSELAHAAAVALSRLHATDRIRELESRLAGALSPPTFQATPS